VINHSIGIGVGVSKNSNGFFRIFLKKCNVQVQAHYIKKLLMNPKQTIVEKYNL